MADYIVFLLYKNITNAFVYKLKVHSVFSKYLIFIFLSFVVLFFLCSCHNKTKPEIVSEIETYIQENSFDKAKDCVKSLEKKYGDIPENYYYKAIICINEKKYSEALSFLNKGKEEFPNFHKYYIGIARLKLIEKDYDSALYFCRYAEIRDSTDFEIFLYKALSYEKLGDTIHAINSFEKSYRLGLKKTNYYYNLGLLYLINKDIEASKKSFKIACSSGINSACKMIDFIKKYKNLQTLYYKNHFTICFPEDFCFSSQKNDILLKLQALDKGLLAFQRFSVVEIDTKTFIVKSNNKQSIFDCPITQIVANMANQVKDFKLLETKKTHVDDENCYFIKYSSNGVFDSNNNIPHITYSWITINPNNSTMISISGFCNINNYFDEKKWEPIFNDIVETFIFN